MTANFEIRKIIIFPSFAIHHTNPVRFIKHSHCHQIIHLHINVSKNIVQVAISLFFVLFFLTSFVITVDSFVITVDVLHVDLLLCILAGLFFMNCFLAPCKFFLLLSSVNLENIVLPRVFLFFLSLHPSLHR